MVELLLLWTHTHTTVHNQTGLWPVALKVLGIEVVPVLVCSLSPESSDRSSSSWALRPGKRV